MFYGRDDVMNDLMALWGKKVSSLITCRGRRRIGKSTLIEQFAKKSRARFIKIEGIKPDATMTNAVQLANFGKYLALQTEAEDSVPSNWAVAFKRLDREIADGERTVVLLDEISWMGRFDPRFADDLRIAWENLWKKHDRLIVVLCGSVSSWIKDNIIDNTAYMGRRSGDFVIGELPLRECVKFWGRAAEKMETREILDVLSVTGGVPRYLEEIDPGLSADENIRRMCYRPKSPLRVDFDEMFSDVIARQPTFAARVLRCLTDGPKTVSEIAGLLEMGRNGHISAALDQLAEAGFVAADQGRNHETGVDMRERSYRLRDNYTRFYLKYVEPVKTVIDSDSYSFVSLEQLEGWDAVMGLAFENLVLNHFREFLPRLGLGKALVVSAAPYRKSGSEKRHVRGCQVDLLVQTENTICLVEVKRRKSIDRGVIDEMDDKVEALSRPKGKTIRTALIYDGKLAQTVEASGYFNAIVNIREILL